MTELILPDTFPPAIGDVDRTVSPIAAAISELDMLDAGEELDIEIANGAVTFSAPGMATITAKLPVGRLTVDRGLWDQLQSAREDLATSRRHGWQITPDPWFFVFALLTSAGEDQITVAA